MIGLPGKGLEPEQHRHLLLTVPKSRGLEEAHSDPLTMLNIHPEFLEEGVSVTFDILSLSGITSHCHMLAEKDGGEHALLTDGSWSTAGGSAGSQMEAFWRMTDIPPV